MKIKTNIDLDNNRIGNVGNAINITDVVNLGQLKNSVLGTIGYIAKFVDANRVSSSFMYDTGTTICVGGLISTGGHKLDIYGGLRVRTMIELPANADQAINMYWGNAKWNYRNNGPAGSWYMNGNGDYVFMTAQNGNADETPLLATRFRVFNSGGVDIFNSRVMNVANAVSNYDAINLGQAKSLFLGINAIAANAALLEGQPISFYVNASNLSAGQLSDARLSSNVVLKNNTNVFSNINIFTNPQGLTGGFGAANTGGTMDWNHVSNAVSGNGYSLLSGIANGGCGANEYFHSFSFEYYFKNGSGSLTQMAIPYTFGNDSALWIRSRYDGIWTSWQKMMTQLACDKRYVQLSQANVFSAQNTFTSSLMIENIQQVNGSNRVLMKDSDNSVKEVKTKSLDIAQFSAESIIFNTVTSKYDVILDCDSYAFKTFSVDCNVNTINNYNITITLLNPRLGGIYIFLFYNAYLATFEFPTNAKKQDGTTPIGNISFNSAMASIKFVHNGTNFIKIS